MRVPSSTPDGIFTDRARSRVTRPEPEQEPQGLSMTWPLPWQFGQVLSRVKKPCACRILPWPPQVGQALGWVPALAPEPEQTSQVTDVGMRICAVLPANASSSLISILYRKSAPRSRAERVRPADIPKMPSNKSENAEPKSVPN